LDSKEYVDTNKRSEKAELRKKNDQGKNKR